MFIVIEKGEPHRVVFIKELKKNTMDQAIDYIEFLHQKFKFKKIVCDQTGIGAGVVDVLSRKYNSPKDNSVKNYNLKVIDSDIIVGLDFTIKNKEDVYSNLKLLMEQNKLKIPNNKKLIYQLKDFRYETTPSGRLKLHHSEGGFDDYCDALCCAAHGVRGKTSNFFFG